MKSTLLCSIPLFFLLVCCSPQSEPREAQSKIAAEERIPVEKLKEDLKILRTSFEEIHPDLYGFISKDSLDLAFDNTAEQLSRPLTKDEFFRILAPLINSLYDEHAGMDFSYKYAELRKFLPVKVRWIKGKAYIVRNLLNNPDLAPGSEILEINHKKIKDIYADIIKHYPNFSTDRSLEYEVYGLHFDHLYASFFEQPDSFAILTLDPKTHKEYMVHTPSLLRSDTLHFLSLGKYLSEYVNPDSCYSFTMDPKTSTAVLKITSFWMGREDFSRVFDRDFAIMDHHKIKHLIIDLRYNRGGDPRFGAMLLTHLYSKPFTIFTKLKASLKKKPTYNEFIDTAGISFVKWDSTIQALKTIEQRADNTYTNLRDSVFYPAKEIFKGDIYLLVNSEVHSGANITAALLDHYAKPLIIGMPMAGPYNSGNAFDMVNITLPNSGLKAYIPMVHYEHNVAQGMYPYKKGIIPKVIVTPSIDDILAGRDKIMDSTLAIIRQLHH